MRAPLPALPEGGLIDTEAGATFVKVKGSGPPVVVIHGGPGFDHAYLEPALSFLAPRRTLVFYDQPGCGRTPAPEGGVSPAHTFAHFRAVASSVAPDQAIGVVAHSLGVLVLIAALSEPDGAALRLSEGLLINPVPVWRPQYDVAVQRFIGRIPLEVQQRFYAIADDHGSEAMNLLLPYYRSRHFDIAPGSFALNFATFKAVSAGLGNFDFREHLAPLRDLSLLVGADDFSGPDLVQDVIAAVRQVAILNGVGHFPFLEVPEDFHKIASAAFE